MSKKFIFLTVALLMLTSIGFAQIPRMPQAAQGGTSLKNVKKSDENNQRNRNIVLLADNFDGTWGTNGPATGWDIVVNGVSNQRWARSNAAQHFFGAASAAHARSTATQGELDGWLITPAITIPNGSEDYELEFLSKNQGTAAQLANYLHNGVWISTSGTALTDFSLFHQLTTANGHFSDSWKRIKLSLNAYKGQTIYLAFRYMGTNADNWYIDDLSVHSPVPYVPVGILDEDFDSPTFPPSGWNNISQAGGNWVREIALTNYIRTPIGSAAFKSASGNQTGWLITPQLSIPANGNDYVLEFWSKNQTPANNKYNGIWVSTTGGATPSDFTEIMKLHFNQVSPDAWREIRVALGKYAGQNIHLAFKYDGASGDSWYVDDVKVYDLETPHIDAGIPEIVSPQAGSYSNLTTQEEVTILIKNYGTNPISNFPITLVLNGGAPVTETFTGTIPSLGEALYTFNAKLDLTTNAGGGSHTITTSVALTGDLVTGNNTTSVTLINCNPYLLPFSEGFVAAWSPASQPPACWLNVAMGEGTGWSRGTIGVGGASGSGMAQHAAGANRDSWLITPPINIPAGSFCVLEFWSRCQTAPTGAGPQHNVYISETGASISDFVQVMQMPTNAVSDWTKIEIPLYNYAGKNIYIAFRYLGNNVGAIWNVDNLFIEDKGGYVDAEIVQITYPANGLNINLTNVEAVKALVRNNGTDPISGFNIDLIYNGTTITEQFQGTIESMTTAEYVFTQTLDLSAAGAHQITVTVNVTGDLEPSNNSKTITANNVICPAITTFPLIESFEDGSQQIPNCWKNERISLNNDWVINWGFVGLPNTAADGDYKAYFTGANGAIARLVMPPMDISQLDRPYLTFFHAMPWSNNLGGRLYVYYKTSAAGNWVLLNTYQEISAWQEVTIELPNKSSDYYISFVAELVGVSTHVNLDNIKVAGRAPLTIISQTPDIDEIDVEIDATVSVTFSEAVTEGNFEGIKITYGTEETEVTGVSANINGAVLTVSHNDFAYETLYKVFIPAAAVAGWENPDITWQFTTKEQPPITLEIVSRTPEINQTGVALNAEVSVTFNENITAGSGFSNIKIYAPNQVEVTGVSATINGAVLTIAHNNFVYETVYSVFIPATAIVEWEGDDITWQFTTQSECAITIFPWLEGFENNGLNIPECWSQERIGINNTLDWRVTPANIGAPATVYAGQYKALFRGNNDERGFSSRLITPSLDLSNVNEPTLQFYHTQQQYLNSNNQDRLRVFYRTSSTGTWVQIVEYATNITTWTERMIPLPNPSDDYQIAFVGIVNNGSGVQLDNIRIMGLNNPVIDVINSPLSFGTVYNNLDFSNINRTNLNVRNTGGGTLLISSYESSDEITLSGLPTTLTALETVLLPVKIDASELPIGAHSGTIMLNSNDPETPQVTVPFTATVASAVVVNFLEEDFDNIPGGIGTHPAGWTMSRFNRLNNASASNSGLTCYYLTLTGTNNTGWLRTCYVRMGVQPSISYWYRVNEGMLGAANPIDPGNYSIRVRATKDNGENWVIVHNAPAGTHPLTNNYVNININLPVDDWANELCIIEFSFTHESGGTFYAFIDDVTVGTPPTNELKAVSVTGISRPTVNVPYQYTVKVKNNGIATQGPADYTVKLMREGDILIQELPGVEITYNQEKDFVFTWTPTALEPTYLYGVVEFANDEFLDNNTTPNFVIPEILPTGSIAIIVGESTELINSLPFYFYYRKSITQTLYYPNELGTNGGLIDKIVYKANISQAKTNSPIQIWVGETNEDNLRDGWIDISNLTEVFDGTMNFPHGVYDAVIPFAAPYQYNGGILVVYAYNKYAPTISNLDRFYGGTDAGSARSRIFYTDSQTFEIDPANPPVTTQEPMSGATFLHTYPNTTLLFNLSGLGSMSGHVTNLDSEAVEGAKVQLVGSQLFTLTDESGFYSFPYLTPATYSIQITKSGYLPKTETGIVVTGDQNVTQNVQMTPIPSYIVSGKVTANDAPNGLANVLLTFTGFENYSASTDAAGNYSIEMYGGLYENFTYNVVATRTGYTTHNSTVNVKDEDVTHNIVMTEVLNPPINPIATVSGVNVNINWTAPAGGAKSLEKYRVYRLENGQTEDWEFLSEVTGTSYTDTDWNVIQFGEYRWAIVAVYTGNLTSEPSLTNVLNNTYVSVTVNITTNGGDTPVGAVVTLTNQDGDPQKVYTQNATSASVLFPNVWKGTYNLTVTLSGYNPYSQTGIEIVQAESIPVNLIETIVTPFGLQVETGNCFARFSWNNELSKALTGYKVYLNGNEIATVSTAEYLFNELETGNYTAGVQAVYTSELSEIVTVDFSVVCIGTYTITFNVRNEDNQPVTGAAIIFNGAPIVGNSVSNIPPGVYPYTVTRDGYGANSGEIEVIDSDVTENVILIKAYTIFFVVFHETTMQPIDDAIITLEGVEVPYIVPNIIPGNYNYSVSREDYHTKTGIVEVTNIDPVVTVALVPENGNISGNNLDNVVLYPNPFTDEIFVNNHNSISNIKIFNAVGQQIKEIKFDGKQINTSNLSSGVYFVIVETFFGKKIVHKMVKK